MKRIVWKKCIALCLLMGLLLGGCAKAEAPYPAKNLHGIVQWGAGGGTDTLMRPLAALAEEALGVSVVVQNMAGATGSIATQYVYDAAADGYTLLMGAENPALYAALHISELTYADFDCVFLIGDEVVGVTVHENAPYQSFTELIAAANENPGTIRLSTTGKGGLPWTVSAFITDITGATFNQIPYDSDASARMAVLNGECDFTVCKVQSGLEDYKAGKLRFLCMLALEEVAAMPDIPLVTEEYPAFAEYLPWGPFYGIFVKKGTDAGMQQTLSDAFSHAGAIEDYQATLANFQVRYLGYTGEEANAYIAAWQENSMRALKKSGALE
ncbi:tripartite tricarboxylate transporter substrate binding protein [Christensenellaceae bacterium OttesenSCG-928-L17]|nr:tripartite tricarboxylate transporter substrate binding protein [Christensenellaceae bacterium OttesenSCG-928-L17]